MTPQSGWPVASALDGTGPAAICWRRRRFLLGGSWGPWTFVQGNMMQGFVPSFRNTPPIQVAAEPEKLTS